MTNARAAVFLDRDGTMIRDMSYLSRVEDVDWYDVPRPAAASLGKRVLRECELIFRGLCTKCAPRHSSR